MFVLKKNKPSVGKEQHFLLKMCCETSIKEYHIVFYYLIVQHLIAISTIVDYFIALLL